MRASRSALAAAIGLLLPWVAVAQNIEPILADHACMEIGSIPDECIEEAKARFRMAYGHTSHGSQIVTGMNLLMGVDPLYSWNADGSGGALSLHDGTPGGDLGNPDRVTWAARTRELLDSPGCDRNFILWSWCGQASTASETDMNTYLDLMDQLEQDYPDVTFVYMTGHLDGSGEAGNLNLRNNQIRDFVAAGNRILFDFADIESYDPDGNYFLDRGADDGCNYDGGNWADEWCAAHPGECASCGCAHSHCLNCQQKGKAWWWLMARLVGGVDGGCAEPVARLLLTKDGEDVAMLWEPGRNQLGYNVWYVTAKDVIPGAFLGSMVANPVAACAAPDSTLRASCIDPGGVSRSAGTPAFYVVRSHCCQGLEGP